MKILVVVNLHVSCSLHFTYIKCQNNIPLQAAIILWESDSLLPLHIIKSHDDQTTSVENQLSLVYQ